MDKLKPCPFCGAKPYIVESIWSGTFHVVCPNEDCYLTGDMVYFKSRDAAAEAWNRRAENDYRGAKRGAWVASDRFHGYQTCSVCRNCFIDPEWFSDGKWGFCPQCGAEMGFTDG